MEDSAEWTLNGELYSDGSMARGLTPELNRAGWSVVELAPGEDLRVAKVLYGVVPDQLPQTSACAEHAAVCVAAEFVSSTSTLTTDHFNIVKSLRGSRNYLLRPSSVNAGLFRHALMQHGWRYISRIDWQKSHVKDEPVEDPVQARRIFGNGQADIYAAMGRQLHSMAPRNDMLDWEITLSQATAIAKLIVNVLPLWPRAPSKLERRQPAEVPPSEPPSLAGCHHWIHRGIWYCRECFRYAFDEPSMMARRFEKCLGVPSSFVSLFKDPKNHVICLADCFESQPVIFCSSCGGYTSGRLKQTSKLARRCRRVAMGFGKTCLKRIEMSKHPVKSVPIVRPVRLSNQTLSEILQE